MQNTINVTEALKDLDGNEISSNGKKLTVGVALANVLITSKDGDKMKCYILAQKLYTTSEKVEIDKSDFQLIKNAVEKNEIYSNLISGQLLLKLI